MEEMGANFRQSNKFFRLFLMLRYELSMCMEKGDFFGIWICLDMLGSEMKFDAFVDEGSGIASKDFGCYGLVEYGSVQIFGRHHVGMAYEGFWKIAFLLLRVRDAQRRMLAPTRCHSSHTLRCCIAQCMSRCR